MACVTTICALDGQANKRMSLPNSYGDMNNHICFFLFEENPFWYTIAYEAIQKLSKGNNLSVVIYGKHLPRFISRERPAIRTGIGLQKFFSILSFLVRRLLWLVPKFRPSSKLHRTILQLCRQNITSEIINPRLHKGGNQYSIEVNELENEIEKIILSALIERKRQSSVISRYHKRKVRKHLLATKNLVLNMQEIILKKGISEVHVINGRALNEAILVLLCKRLGLRIFAHENNLFEDRLQSLPTSVLNTEFIASSATQFWMESKERFGDDIIEKLASEFFTARRTSVLQNVFLKDMSVDFDKSIFDNQRKIYSFFTSSNDELHSLHMGTNDVTPNQEALIWDLVKEFTKIEHQDKLLIVRVHPNLKNKSRRDRDIYRELEKDIQQYDSARQIAFFNFDSNADSYEIIQKSEVVMTISSTVGLEAAYSNIPSFSFGSNFWEHLQISPRLKGVSELWETKYVMPSLARENALIYAFWTMYFGERFKHVDLRSMKIIDDDVNLDVLVYLRRAFGRTKYASESKLDQFDI